MSHPNKEIILGYVPVIHKGYLDLLERHPFATIGVLEQEVLQDFDYLRKDIRALEPAAAATLICGLGRKALLIGLPQLHRLDEDYDSVIMPNDDVSRSLQKIHQFQTVEFEPIFLRWDRENSKANVEVTPDRTISSEDSHFHKLIAELYKEAEKSSNWWRRLAAAALDDGGKPVAISRNQSQPTDYSSLLDSDPRISEKRGHGIEVSIDIHAEAKLIAEMAKTGYSLDGKSILVTTFPCPTCAKLIANSGIKKCYYIEGYATLDGQSILKAFDVEIIKVDASMPVGDPRELKPYPHKSNS